MPSTPPVQLTMLNGMAGADFEQALSRHVALGLQWLDLKDSLYGQSINELSIENAHQVAVQAQTHGLKIHCLSSSIGFSHLEEGETVFRTRHLRTLDHVLQVAAVLQPNSIRLLGARAASPPGESPMPFVERQYPWVFAVYRTMIDRIHAAGWAVGIENETDDCILASVGDILHFFEKANPENKAYCIYDVQNLWQMGSFPSLEVYRQLKPLLGGFHLKGGRSGGGTALEWASALDEASWPVLDIVRAVVADGVAPVICLNPSHGKKPTGYNGWEVAQRDIAFLRKNVAEIE